MKYFFAVIFLFINVITSNAQWSTTPIKTEIINLTAILNQRNYKITVALPSSYNKAEKYPVYYLLDGYYAFPMAIESMKVLKMGNEIKDFILVSIAGDETNDYEWFVKRWTDFTFTQKVKTDSSFTKNENIKIPGLISGEGETFYKIIKDEIVPLIDSKYSTNDERGISGHSLSGLFVANVLFKSDGVFSRFGINSPSFFEWDNDIMQTEKKYSQSNTNLNANVFISIGELEGETETNNLLKFDSLLKKYTGLKSKLVIFKDESHTSVCPAMISRTMKILYSKKD
jgi:predicted alpha/beta superfamily hydrolase